MLANRKAVRAIVQKLANLEGSGIYRRQWCDKTKVSSEQRLMTFRFWDPQEADEVAKRLQFTLKQQGYTNEVKRTSVDSSWGTQTEGGEYVRVRVMFE